MRSRHLTLLAWASLLGATPALAQTPVQKVYDCASLAGDAQRLACFDASVSNMKSAETKGDLTIVTRQQAIESDRQQFGLRSQPKAAPAPATAAAPRAPAAKPPREESLNSLTLNVVSITPAANGDLVFTMENGQVWRQSEKETLVGIGKGPWKAEIRKAALGSFMLKLDRRTAIRVKRVN